MTINKPNVIGTAAEEAFDEAFSRGLAPGTRVELHPATDAWMRGDRYGEIMSLRTNVRAVSVRLDKSGKTVWIAPRDIGNVIEKALVPTIAAT